VTFTIRRPDRPDPIEFTIVRAIYKVRYIRSRMLEGKIGYIRLSSFMGKEVAVDFATALARLSDDGMRGLVIDLRNNPGGLMDAALQIVDLFVEEGLIFEVRARHAALSMSFDATREGTLPPRPMVVLINRGSASASEIVAGILQDTDLATVVGTTSFGKGSVQRIVSLTPQEEGSAIALTTSLYFLLGKRKVHQIGIEPDVVVEVDPDLEAEIARRSIYLEKSEKIDDPVLERAIEILTEPLEDD
jgi:carboxyl-terminal processing protease